MFALGKGSLEVGGRLRLDPRHQSALLVLQQSLEDRLDLDRRFSLAVDDLGKSTAYPAVQVHLGEATRILVRLELDLSCGFVRGNAPVANRGKQLFELVDKILVSDPRRPGALKRRQSC